jgi:hypothetical protein
LSLKTKVDGLSVVWPQNHWDGFLRFDLKIGGDCFLWFGLKIGGNCFLWFDIKIDGDNFFRFSLKIGGVFLSLTSRLVEAQWWVVHVAPSCWLHQDQVEDGGVDATVCIGLYYHFFVIFVALGHMCIIVFSVFYLINKTLEGLNYLSFL